MPIIGEKNKGETSQPTGSTAKKKDAKKEHEQKMNETAPETPKAEEKKDIATSELIIGKKTKLGNTGLGLGDRKSVV